MRPPTSEEQQEIDALAATYGLKSFFLPPSLLAKPIPDGLSGNLCPECGGLLRMESGCDICPHCHYSKCG